MSLYYKLEMPLVNNNPVFLGGNDTYYSIIDIPFYQRPVFLSPVTDDPDWAVYLEIFNFDSTDNPFHFKLIRTIKEYCIWKEIELPAAYYQIAKDSFIAFLKLVAENVNINESDTNILGTVKSGAIISNGYYSSRGLLMSVNNEETALALYSSMQIETYINYFVTSQEWDVPGSNGLVELSVIPEDYSFIL